MEHTFWTLLDKLVSCSQIIIDRPRGSCHPRYSHVIYPLDYGYLADTSAMDGDGIDVWVGNQVEKTVDGIICTVDLLKRDSEMKVLLGCTQEDMHTILAFHNDSEYMKGILIQRGNEQ